MPKYQGQFRSAGRGDIVEDLEWCRKYWHTAPRALRFFHEENPGVRVQLYDMSTREILRGLRDGKLEVALLIEVPPKVLTGIVFKELRRYGVWLATHPLAWARKVSLEQVANEPLIVYTRADYPEYHSWLSDLFAPLKRRPPVAEEHDGATSLIASGESGRGVALVQQGFDRLSGPRLKVRPLTPTHPPHVVGVAYRKGVNSPATKNFIAAAKCATSASSTGSLRSVRCRD
jgi:DNA-binding transcriptional LysR family regulator